MTSGTPASGPAASGALRQDPASAPAPEATSPRGALKRVTQAILLPAESLLTTREAVRVVSLAIYRTLTLLMSFAMAGIAYYLRSGSAPVMGDPVALGALQTTGLRLWIATAVALLLLWPLERRLRWLQVPDRLLIWTLGCALVGFGGYIHFLTADLRPMLAGLAMCVAGVAFFPIRAR